MPNSFPSSSLLDSIPTTIRPRRTQRVAVCSRVSTSDERWGRARLHDNQCMRPATRWTRQNRGVSAVFTPRASTPNVLGIWKSQAQHVLANSPDKEEPFSSLNTIGKSRGQTSFGHSPLGWPRWRPFCTSHDENCISGLCEMAMIDLASASIVADEGGRFFPLLNSTCGALRPDSS